MKKVIVGISGASGTIYGVRLIQVLLELNVQVTAVLSRAGEKVLAHEQVYEKKKGFAAFLKTMTKDQLATEHLEVFASDQIDASIASGSSRHDGMVVAPCSMKTLSAVSSGFADNLIARACDVCLKEKRPLILVPRETPFNRIHLENMLRAHDAGAVIMPPNPSFYTFPQTIEELVDTVVSRILDHLKIENDLTERWSS